MHDRNATERSASVRLALPTLFSWETLRAIYDRALDPRRQPPFAPRLVA